MLEFNQAPARQVRRLSDLVALLGPCPDFDREDRPIAGFCVDSRKLNPGEVFVAVSGARVDGHRFVDEAIKKGAAACLVSSLDGIQNKGGCVPVADTVRALGFLAAAHRRALPVKIIGLTGSVGKTTTKDILHALLSVVSHARKSEGNHNNQIGLPIQLLRLQPSDEWMVAEMGMSTPGEIRQLMRMAKPDLGLFLSVQAVHLANFANVEEIAKAKAELVEELGPDKTLVYNLDNHLVHKHSASHPGPKFTYSFFDPDADLNARVEPFPNWRGVHFELRFKEGRRMPLYLPMTGRYNARNALAACATAIAAGFKLSEISYALREVEPPGGRSNLAVFEPDIMLVDDTYNASPHAVKNVLRCFAPLSNKYYRWIVLGDMLELGPTEEAVHRELGKLLAGYGFDRITLVGPLCAHTYSVLRELHPPDCDLERFHTADEALAELRLDIPPKARIWCKASRGIGLEKVAHGIEAHFRAG